MACLRLTTREDPHAYMPTISLTWCTCICICTLPGPWKSIRAQIAGIEIFHILRVFCHSSSYWSQRCRPTWSSWLKTGQLQCRIDLGNTISSRVDLHQMVNAGGNCKHRLKGHSLLLFTITVSLSVCMTMLRVLQWQENFVLTSLNSELVLYSECPGSALCIVLY